MTQVLTPKDVLRIREMYRRYIENTNGAFMAGRSVKLGEIVLPGLRPSAFEVYSIANGTVISIKDAEYRLGFGKDLLLNLRGELINE